MKRRSWITVLAVIVLVASLGAAAYPLVGNWIAERNQQDVVAAASAKMQENRGEWHKMEQDAQAYNAALADGMSNISRSIYNQTLSVTDDGLMGILEIPCLDVEIPIYHDSTSDVLAKGIGHVYGSSLPIGGKGTHAALSGHSGMSNQRMLTDLPNMQKGDFFIIRVLGKTLTYQVDQIRTVLPDDVGELQIDPDKDMVTLITCTPYGINSHRLLVRGVRVSDEDAAAASAATSRSSVWWHEYGLAALQGLGLAAVPALIVVVIVRRRRKKDEQKENVTQPETPKN